MQPSIDSYRPYDDSIPYHAIPYCLLLTAKMERDTSNPLDGKNRWPRWETSIVVSLQTGLRIDETARQTPISCSVHRLRWKGLLSVLHMWYHHWTMEAVRLRAGG